MERKRFDEVDVLRAFGIIGVIVVHILTYNLSSPINIFIWNNLQFFVVAFVFCSGFVLSSIYKNSFTSFKNILLWYKKRFTRLIIPFWIYLIIHYSLWIIFPNFFQGLGLVKNLDYFIKSALFVGGTNFNFLSLLFLQLTFLFPLLIHWIHKKNIIVSYLLGTIFISTIFSFAIFPYSLYRFVMWVPWSLVLLFSIYISKKVSLDVSEMVTNKRYLIIGVATFIIFLLFYNYNLDIGRSTNFYDHKYPPDLYYLLFGISLTCFSLVIARLKIWKNESIKKIYFFISNNSYQIFFIHYIVLDSVLLLAKNNYLIKNPFVQFIIIFSISVFLAIAINKSKKLLKIK